MALCFSAHARGFYGIAGGGIAEHPMSGGRGHWQQAPEYSTDIDTRSPTFTLGVGYQVKPWLAFEADYRDLGSLSGHIQFTTDEAYSAGEPGPLYTAYINSQSRGIGLSALLSTGNKSTPLARIGIFYHDSTFAPILVNGTTLTTFHDDGNPLDDKDIGWMFGVGWKYNNVRVEYTYFPNVAAQNTPYWDVQTVTVSVTF